VIKTDLKNILTTQLHFATLWQAKYTKKLKMKKEINKMENERAIHFKEHRNFHL